MYMVMRRNGRSGIDQIKYYTSISISINSQKLKQTSMTLKRDDHVSHGFRNFILKEEVTHTEEPSLQRLM